MSLTKTSFVGQCKIAALSNVFSNTLLLTPRASIPASHLALFATQSKTKSIELILPKKPLTAFFMFRGEKYEQLKTKNPKASVAELGAILGQQWKALDEGQREIYTTRYASGMEDYNKQIAAIEADPTMNLKLVQLKEEKAQERKEKAYKKALKEKKSLMKDLGRPKRSVSSPYSLFSQEKFSFYHQKGKPVSETTKIISEAWTTLNETQKEAYASRYNVIKEQYDAELNAWKEKMDTNEENKENIQKLNAKVNQKRKLKSKGKNVEE